MITHLLSYLPWEAWAVIAVAIVLVVWARFGNTSAAVVGGLFVAFIAFMAGRKAERQQGQVQEQQHADDIQTRADDARDSVSTEPDSSLRKPSPYQRD